jgi:tetratricopeptide (TPR) repeat protein
MAYTDSRGLVVSTMSSEALDAYEHGVACSLRWRSGALDALDTVVTSDPQFILGHCTRAYIAWRMGRYDVASASHQQAIKLADTAYDERERLHIRTVDAMHRSAGAEVLDYLEQIVEQYPTDRMALRLFSILCLAQGTYAKGLMRARRSYEAAPDDTQFQTMLAFFLDQANKDPDAGLALGLRALAADPGNLYTYHAVGHHYAARGDYRNALAIFERANSVERYPHNIWHLAEAHAILGDRRLTHDYWASTAPMLPLFERIELRWRLETLRGEPVDDATWRDLAAQGERLLANANYLTTWMHHWIGVAFARAGDMQKAQQQLAHVRQLPEGPPSGYWSTLGAGLLEGEIAFIRGDLDTAAQCMTPAVQRIHEMGGGSREQKDIFVDVCLELHRRLGHVEQVIELAQRRLQRNPNHFQSFSALAWAYHQTGQTANQQQMCREIVERAEALSVPPDLPALREARQTLQVTA